MKNYWKILINMALPLLRAAGEAKQAEDENTTGKDDLIGLAMVFAADLLDAIVKDKPLPKAPKALQ
jgi:hypothetical protein